MDEKDLAESIVDEIFEYFDDEIIKGDGEKEIEGKVTEAIKYYLSENRLKIIGE